MGNFIASILTKKSQPASSRWQEKMHYENRENNWKILIKIFVKSK